MVIELRGVEFVNKGAQLMLHAIIDKVEAEIPDAIFAMDTGARVPLKKLRENNIYKKLSGRRYSKLAVLIPKKLRRMLGWVLDKEVEVILDGSGFAFGDQWGAAYANRRIGERILRWKQQGKKLILLPQAFGPFNEPELKNVMNKILFHADLVFAREEQSYQYLKETSSHCNIRIAPDFTVLIKGNTTAVEVPERLVPIIPNYKMMREDAEAYTDFLTLAISRVAETGLKPYFLIHEGKPDLEIAEQINSQLEEPLEIIVNEDPLVVKGIIGRAYFVICSRFHGVVSALSQAVPCLVTSWSHKYEMLLREYDFEQGLVKDLRDHVYTRNMIAELACPATNKRIAQKLSRYGDIHRERSAGMWDMVFATINQES